MRIPPLEPRVFSMNHKDTKPQREPISDQANDAARITVNAAFTVHSHLGPGLLESVYAKCLAHAIRRRGLVVESEMVIPIEFEGLHLPAALRMDMVVNHCLIVEVKAVDALLPVHRAQLLTYLKLSGRRLGLQINFNVPVIKNGITRVVC
jgi:GxxExxY protein